MADPRGSRARGKARAPASSSRPPRPTPTSLADLPTEVLHKLCAELLDVQDLRQLRLAARWLRPPASAAVRTLVARAGCLPAKAWAAFPCAAGLRVEVGRGGYYFIEHFMMQRLLKLAETLPAGRLELLQLADSGAPPWEATAPDALFFLRLLTPAAGLKRLDAGFCLSVQAADELLRGLPRLEHLDLYVQAGVEGAEAAAAAGWEEAPPAAGSPASLQHFPPGLTCLQLQLNSIINLGGTLHVGDTIDLDCAELAACSRLRKLELQLREHWGTFSNISSLSALSELEQLIIDGPHPQGESIEPHDDIIAAVSQLPGLWKLSMVSAYAWATAGDPAWAGLAAMPALAHLELLALTLDMLHPSGPLLHVTTLVVRVQLEGAEDPDTRQVPELQPGCLTALLPQLQRFEVLGGT
jgi:hypothetical protein